VNACDVIIAGAGIIGISLALELHERGARVLVLDRGEPGREASFAAAGMLAASDPETPPALRELAFESARIFPEYVRKLEDVSGLKADFRRQGTIAFSESYAEVSGVKKLSSEKLRQIEPAVQGRSKPAFFVPEDSVDPRLLMRAAVAAARKPGIDIRSNTEIREFRGHGDAVEVITNQGALASGAAVDCRGAWSGAPVRPRKGQMLYLQPERTLLQHVIHAPDVYIVPRSSGKILVGATVEDVGFDTTVEPSTIQELLTAACGYLPELRSASIVETWAGLRPGTPDNLPILGPTSLPRLFAASGHFRNGILLAPVTAKIMAELITGNHPKLDLSAFSPARFATANHKGHKEARG
jgi:glycine oxidase